MFWICQRIIELFLDIYVYSVKSLTRVNCLVQENWNIVGPPKLKLIGGCTKLSFGGQCCQYKTKTATEMLFSWELGGLFGSHNKRCFSLFVVIIFFKEFFDGFIPSKFKSVISFSLKSLKKEKEACNICFEVRISRKKTYHFWRNDTIKEFLQKDDKGYWKKKYVCCKDIQILKTFYFD